MRTFKTLTLVAIAILGFTSCSNDDDAPQLLQVDSVTVSNLYAPTTSVNGPMGPTSDGGPFTKFDFSTGTITTSDTEWDIAFRSTTIIVNGGTETGTNDEPERNGNAAGYVAVNTFAGVTSVDNSLFEQDSTNEGFAIPNSSSAEDAWYTYTGQSSPNQGENNRILPKDGRILVFRTRDGKYAKVEIVSYYKDNPDNPDSTIDEPRYYTFNYIYQPNDGVTTFE